MKTYTITLKPGCEIVSETTGRIFRPRSMTITGATLNEQSGCMHFTLPSSGTKFYAMDADSYTVVQE